MTDFEASFLHLTEETSPVKVTFLTAAPSGHHVFGYFFVESDGRFGDAKLLFPKVHRDTLISSVSAVFLSARAVAGKKLCFFVIENGFDDNADVPCFQDVVFGRNGTLKFFESPKDDTALLMAEKGAPVWKTADKGTTPAVPATLFSKTPVPVWQGADASLSVLSGAVCFSAGGALYPSLNAQNAACARLTPEESSASFVLSFKKNRETLISVRLNVGEKNFAALTEKRVGLRLMPDLSDKSLVTKIVAESVNGSLCLDGVDDAVKKAAGVNVVTQTPFRVDMTGNLPVCAAEALIGRICLSSADSRDVKQDTVTLRVAADGAEMTLSEESSIQNEEREEKEFSVLPSLSDSFEPTGNNLFIPARDIPAQTEQNDPLPSFLFENDAPRPAEKIALPLISAEKTGKTVLVTGGAKRIGRAICETMAAKGWNVIVHCRESMAQAGRLVDELKQKYGVDAFYVRADLSDENETRDLIPNVLETGAVPDALVNAAAVFVKDGIDTLTEESFAENMAVNLRAPLFLIRDFARLCDKKADLSVVNLLDQRILNPTPYFTSYTLSKAGLGLLTRTLALALAPRVRINGIALGDVLPAEGQSKHDFDYRIASTPLKKNISVETVAQTTAFLLENPNMTGVILPLDNGQSMNWSPETA